MVLIVLFFAIAILYSAVGLAGGTGYLAVMALYGIAPEEMKPTALLLNIVVASIAFGRFYKAGHFTWAKFWPFALPSIPCAFLGGRMSLAPSIYRPIVGVALIYAAWRLVRSSTDPESETRSVPTGYALFSGAAIGLFSGLTGMGGGIFLSPLMISTGWASPRQTAGTTSMFILTNSLAGILGHLSSTRVLPEGLPFWAVTVLVGGWLGAGIGSKYADARALRIILAMVLVVGGIRLQLG